MFNRTIINEGDKHTTNVRVEQAGLHDAVRNYKEFRDDAEKQAAQLEIRKFGADNEIKLLRVEKTRGMEADNLRVLIVFSINGTVYQVEKVFPRGEFDERMQIYYAIADEIVKRMLATEPKKYT